MTGTSDVSDPRWMLVMTGYPFLHIMAITEDAEDAAVERGWLVVARESDILTERI